MQPRQARQTIEGGARGAHERRDRGRRSGLQDRLAIELATEPAELPLERHDDEERGHEEQEQQDQCELDGVHRVGDLPDLGAEQQEDDEDHEQRQRSRNELDQVDQLEPQPLERPQTDLDEAEADEDVDHADARERAERRRDGLEDVLVDEGRRQGREERDRRDVEHVEGRWPDRDRPPPEPADDGPDQGHPGDRGGDADEVRGQLASRAACPSP